MKNIYDNRQVRRWEDIPFTWRVVDAPSQVKIKSFNPKDKDFAKVFGVFASEDELRPAMTGVNFDDKGLCVTDAHKLVYFPKSKYAQYFPKEEGIFEFGSGREIGDRYPNYTAVISQNNDEVYQVDVVKLLTYCKMIIEGKYCNQTTFHCNFVYGKDKPKMIGVNLKFLISILEFWLRMGFNKLFMSIEAPNRGVIFSPYEKGVKGKNILDYPITLLMPVMVVDDYFGARDLDYDRECLVHYVISEDEIYDVGDKMEDVKPATFDRNLTSYIDPNFSAYEIKMWSKLISKSFMPILDCVKIKIGVATITNLTTFINKSGINIPDGLYNIINGSLSKSTLDIDDFPNIVAKDSIVSEYNGKFEFDEFRYHYDNALKCVGNDELRPTLMSVHINESLIEGSNGKILYRQKLKTFVDGLDVMIKEPKWLSEVMYVIDDDQTNSTNDIRVQIYTGDYNSKKVLFVFDRYEVYCRIEEGKYPNTQSIIPSMLANNLVVDEISSITDAMKLITKEQVKEGALISFKHGEGATELLLADTSGSVIGNLGMVKSSYSNKNESSETGLFCMPSPKGASIYDFTLEFKVLKDCIDVCGKKGKINIDYNGSTTILLMQNANNFDFIASKEPKKKAKTAPVKNMTDENERKVQELRLRARARIRILALKSN